ncbi:peptide chain release factor N(5)-glutamine methyltransferase [Spongiibacter nanhainus]|uniref:peptide chain release factor N(5)-glutamine methyltransferase n=1 Tax=Spongiibacter nanhainus TaxID=2794344 RepID=UPI001E2C181A|nr:peptide chain release factor N(5)-glutamine methyltransferase [Spongiibacter nanhainus]
MLTIAEALRSHTALTESDSAQLDTALLLCHCLQQPRSYLYTWPEKTLSETQGEQFRALMERRQRGEPVAYLLGYREFWSLSLQVSADTLIPRPDTECVVEQALLLVDAEPAHRVLDLGTGTGAIALALASERPHWRVTGSDVKPAAVALAQANAQQLAIANVAFLQANWFDGLTAQRFALIVSNPPYIAADDPHLGQGDLRFEPSSALVAQQNGLADLQHIIDTAPDYLLPGGWLLLEHGFEQGSAVRELLTQRGYLAVASGDDYGGNQRMSWGQWPAESEQPRNG